MSWLLLAGLAAALIFWSISDPAEPTRQTVESTRETVESTRETAEPRQTAEPTREAVANGMPPDASRGAYEHDESAQVGASIAEQPGAPLWPKRVAMDTHERPAADIERPEREPSEREPSERASSERESSPPVVANPRLAPRSPSQRASDDWSGPKNPRDAPPGTIDANAEALRRLPTARADKPPIGGVGTLGIHVDRVEMGSIYDAGKCSGHTTGFSAQRNDRVSICFRVVHPRTTQQVNVLWQRNGEVVRRTRMTIPAAHAYRTRAFIVLRDGDAGRWTVRVVSSDDVELARARFDVGA